jgi:hypothetical protein
MMSLMRTTLNISDAILDEVRELARERRRPFRKVLEEVLQLGLSSGKTPPRPIRLVTHRVGIKPAYQAQSMNQLYDQIEAEQTMMQEGR